jgi:hypothetical protein
VAGRLVRTFGADFRLGDLRRTGRQPDFFADTAFRYIDDSHACLDKYGYSPGIAYTFRDSGCLINLVSNRDLCESNRRAHCDRFTNSRRPDNEFNRCSSDDSSRFQPDH